MEYLMKVRYASNTGFKILEEESVYRLEAIE